MNYFNKNRVVFWIMILMIVINISAFTSFFIYYRPGKPVVADTLSCGGSCRFLNDQLALNTDQAGKVSEINKQFRDQSEPVVLEIKSIRTALLAELASDKPDTASLNRYADRIGELQKKLQRAAVVQFQQLKQVCTPDQCLKLSAIYSELYGCEKMNQDKGMRMQHRFGGGQENKECKKNR
ncbi:MAG: Spy/CpxP family protein refolding chaperone [Bacteroidales bacterium]